MAEMLNCLKKRNGKIIWILLAVVTTLLSFVIYCALSEKSTESLRLIFVVFRHGDRTPTETYKNDPYINYSWPDGWGSLTNKGKLQLHELGQSLNARYKLLIDENFSINDVYVRSSDADRCHMSGATLLAGMFPPNSKQIWNKNLLWQPVPIHALPRNLDNLIAMKQKCPTYDNALKNAYQSEEIKQLNEQNKELYTLLTENTGQDMSNITAVEFLYNTLEIEENNGLKLPAWTKGIYPNRMKSIAARSLAIFTETPFMGKMKGGVLIKDMVNQIENKLKNGITSGRRIFLYSAHDISLVNLLRPLGFLEYIKPEYGAAFVLEVHSTTSNDLEIKMFYYNSSLSQEPHALSVPSCSSPCLFTDFIATVKPVIPNNWEQECQHAN